MPSGFSLREWLDQQELVIASRGRAHYGHDDEEDVDYDLDPLSDDEVDRLQVRLEEAQVAAIMKGPTGDRVRELWREADPDV